MRRAKNANDFPRKHTNFPHIKLGDVMRQGNRHVDVVVVSPPPPAVVAIVVVAVVVVEEEEEDVTNERVTYLVSTYHYNRALESR